MVLIPQLAFANNIYFNNISSARKVKSEIDYLKENSKFYSNKYSYCDAERINLNAQNGLLKEQTDSLKKDKQVLLEVSEEYKKRFIDTNKELEKVKDSIPSRLTWFTTGMGAAIIVGIVSSFALK